MIFYKYELLWGLSPNFTQQHLVYLHDNFLQPHEDFGYSLHHLSLCFGHICFMAFHKKSFRRVAS